jgi:hypothetical protein
VSVSHDSPNFRYVEVLFDLAVALRAGPNLVAFEVIGAAGDFDVDVYELGAADRTAFGQ